MCAAQSLHAYQSSDLYTSLNSNTQTSLGVCSDARFGLARLSSNESSQSKLKSEPWKSVDRLQTEFFCSIDVWKRYPTFDSHEKHLKNQMLLNIVQAIGFFKFMAWLFSEYGRRVDPSGEKGSARCM